PDLGDFMLRAPGERGGRLADVATETSVLADAATLSSNLDQDSLNRPERAMSTLLSRADAGDAGCLGALAKAGEALGFAVANLITLFAPPKVIVSGRAMAASRHFIAPLRATVAALLPPSLADVSEIVVREWSDRIWVQGAAAMTLRDLYGAPWGTTGPATLRGGAVMQGGGST